MPLTRSTGQRLSNGSHDCHQTRGWRCFAALRALFVFDARRTAVLLLGADKSGAWQAWHRQAIPRAEQLYERYLAEPRDEGLT
ncbi:MAG: type II toxin-antitoxin system RelE/ParE family toxin [Egibacteraceae bacterium]